MTFNPKYRAELELKLLCWLDKIYISSGYVDLDHFYEDGESFVAELEKKVEEFTGKWGAYASIILVLEKFIPDVTWPKEEKKKLVEISPNSRDEISSAIINYFESLPHSNEVFLQIGDALTTFFNEIKISNEISFTHLSGTESFMQKAEKKDYIREIVDKRPSLSKENVYIKICKSGLLSNDLTKPSVIGILSDLKKILYLGYASEAIILNPRASVFSKRGKRDLVFRDINFSPDLLQKIELTSDFGEFAFKLNLARSLKEKPQTIISRMLDQNKETEVQFKTWEESYSEFFHLTKKLLTDTTDTVKVDPIKRAIDWAYNALCTQEINLSFIQGCMALEALLGDDINSKKGLHETLADRFSYLISDNNATRRKSRENFLEIYDCRSEIVHGTRSHLHHDKLYLQSWLNKVLSYLIKKEIRSL